MKQHYMNERQILDSIYDFENDAIRTVPHQNQEFAIAISHTDNDSAATVAVQEVKEDGIHSCVGMRRAALYGSTAKLSVSPSVDGEDFVVVQDNSIAQMAVSPVTNICAVRVKVEGNGKLVLQG
jgi:hypothetical protein